MTPRRFSAIFLLAAFFSVLAAPLTLATNTEPVVAVNVGAIAAAFSEAGSLATARYHHTASVLANGKVLVTGGQDNSDALTSVEIYDPASNTWTATGSLIEGRDSHTASVLANGKVLVIGAGGAELYDPASNTWIAAGSLITGRKDHTASVLANGKVLVTGGEGSSGPLSSAELYDPASNTWTAAGSLITGRKDHTASVLANGKVLVTGGQGNRGRLSSAELYDPASNTWRAAGRLSKARYSHTASVLANGKVLVIGGYNGKGGFPRNAELYDPTKNTWRAAGSLATGRLGHTASVLGNGNVLVMGGGSAELYNPASNTWRAAGSLITGREYHTASVLANGRVLVTGGYGNNGVLNNAELCELPSAAVTAVEGATAAQAGTFSDVNGKKTVTLSASSGTVAQNNAAGTWSWTPAAGFDGPANTIVTITATDSSSATASAAFAFIATNSAPTAEISAAAAAKANVPVIYTFTATDASVADQAGAFSWTLDYGDGTGAQTVAGTSLLAQTHTFTNVGTFTVTAVATDKDGGAGPVAVRSITIGPAAITTAASFLSVTGAALNGTVNANGFPAAVTFSYGTTTAYGSTVTAAQSPVTGLAVTAVSASVAALAPHTLYHFRVSATTSAGTSLGADATFTTLNSAPVAAAQSVSANEDTARTVTLAGTDADGDTLGFALAARPAHGTVAFSGSMATYTPELDFNGIDSFAFTASDAFGGVSAPATVSITVIALNDGPAIAVNSGAAGFSAAGSLATGRYNHTASVLANGKVLVTGGQGRPYVVSHEFDSAELYNPANNTWTAAGSLATKRTNHTASVLVNGKVLVTGGININDRLSSAELYDPASNTWTAAGSLSTERYNHTASVLANGKVLVIGGYGSTGAFLSAELYDPASNTWTAAGSPATGHAYHTASVLANGKVLVTGGYDNNDPLSSAELYDPASNTWTAAGSLATRRTNHTASVLANGKVLVTGGYNSISGYLGSAELYDPASNTWTEAGSLATGHAYHTASVLANGKVLVTGGYNGKGGVLSSAELYDPASNTWTAAASLATGREAHTASVLANGKVLVTGGYGYPSAISSAELYGSSPAAGTAVLTAAEGAAAAQIGTFSDVDGNVTVTLSASWGTVTQNNAAGTWSWTPAAGFDGPASTTVTITATDSASATASESFNFVATNSAPTAAISAAPAAKANAPVSYTFNATDTSVADQAGAFSWTLDYGDGTGAQTVAGTSSLAQTHAFPNAGTFNVTAVATDKDGGASSVATQAIAIEKLAAITAAASSLSVTRAALNGTVNANGFPAAVTFSYGTTTAYGSTVTAAQSPVSGLAVTAVSAAVAALSPHTLYHFRVNATTSEGSSLGGDATFSTLNSVPVAASKSVSTKEDKARVLTLAATDADGDTLSFALTTQPAHGTVALSGSTATYTPALDFGGTDSFSFTVSDAFGGISAPAKVSLTVMAPNHSPAIAVNNGTAVFSKAGSLATGRTNHTASVLANGKVLITRGEKSYGSYLSSAELYDSSPAAGTVVLTAAEGTLAAQTGTFSDTDGNETVTLSASSGTVTQNNAAGTWSWTPAAGFDGPASTTVKITATDSARAKASAAFTFTAINLAPTTAISAAPAAKANAPVSYTFSATDASVADQAGAFSWTLDYGDGTGAQTVAGTSSLAQTHAFPNAGTFNVTAVAIDKDGGASSVATQAIAIEKPAAITAAASSLSVTGAALNGTVNANGFPAAVTFSYGTTTAYGSTATAAQSPVSGSAATAVSAAVAALSPHTLYHFRVNATNSEGSSLGGDATFSTLNTAPVAASQSVSTNEDTARTVTLAGTDADGDTLSFAVATRPAHGTVAVSGSTATYTPGPDFNGTDSFAFTASDAFGGISAPATVSLTVMALNDAPAIAVDGGLAAVFSEAGSLATGRTNHTASVLANGKVLVTGGDGADIRYNSSLRAYLSSAELYDPASNTWTAAGSLATGRTNHTASVLANGKVLVTGGLNTSVAPGSEELYDPASNTWTEAGSLATGRAQHTASVLVNGKVLVTGGYGGTGAFLRGAELYDPASNTWTAAGSLATARAKHTASVLANGKVLVTGGFNGGYLNSAELYDPASNTWTEAGSLATARYSHTASVLANGKVLVTGGYGGTSAFLRSAELYDPGSNTWTAAGSLANARDSHTASVLANGKVLVTAGLNTSVAPGRAELYDSASNAWTATADSLVVERYNHTASVLANGKVLITGGENIHGGLLSSAELYNAPLVGLTIAEGAAAAQAGTFSDADGNATVTLSASSGTVAQNSAAGTWSWTPAAGFDGPARATVTITATDPASATASATFTFTAINLAPTAAISAAAVAKANAPVSYTFSATDASVADQAGAFSWTLDYGDGTGVQTVAGTSSLAQTHTFTNAGTFNVTAAATDKNGGVSSASARSITIGEITAPAMTYTGATAMDATTNTAPATFSVAVLPLSAAAEWRHAHFGTTANSGAAADTADPDGDGLSNLQERAFGTDPMNGGSGGSPLEYAGTLAGSGTIVRTGQPRPKAEVVENGINVMALFVRRTDWVAQGLIYTVEFSADLITWAASAAVPAVLADDGIAQVVAIPYPLLTGGKPARFFRVVVRVAP